MFKRILVPLDGSETAEQVLPLVIMEAQLHGAAVVFLRVIAPLRRSLMSIPSVLDQVYRQIDNIAEEYLENIAEKARAEGLIVETLVERGLPAVCIINTVQDRNCDLIIIGSHGESSALHWRYGSVANKVLRTKLSIRMIYKN